MSEQVLCELCGQPMPKGEEMFNYRGEPITVSAALRDREADYAMERDRRILAEREVELLKGKLAIRAMIASTTPACPKCHAPLVRTFDSYYACQNAKCSGCGRIPIPTSDESRGL
jgi:hypothetical protein